MLLKTVDFDDTALKVTVANVPAAPGTGFAARPPVHVNVAGPAAIVFPTVCVRVLPPLPAILLLLIVPLEDTQFGDAFAFQIAPLAVIVIDSLVESASVTPIENSMAVGVAPEIKLPVTATAPSQTSEALVT